MSGARQLLDRLRQDGARLRLIMDEIEIEAPATVLNEEALAEVRRHRDPLCLLLRLEKASSVGRSAVPGQVSAIEAKRALGWDAHRFTRLCHRLIGRPGSATAKEDQTVLDAILALVQKGTGS